MKKTIAYLALALALCGCREQTVSERRSAYLASAAPELLIAVAWPLKSAKGTLLNGVALAQEEINRAGGLIDGKQVRLLLKDDEASLSKGRLVAQEIANNDKVAAVIGHLNSYITAPSSAIYEQAGLLMMTPGASGHKITESGARLVFRSLPGNRDQGQQIADYAAAQGYKNIAIYYIKNDYGVDLANCFEQRAGERGITIVDRRSYNMNADNHSAILADWASFLKTDAIFLVGSLPESGQILQEARAAGITLPIFGGAGLDSPDLIRLAGKSAEGTVVFALFNSEDPRPEVRSFVQRYRDKFGTLPDSTAAQGYDAMSLLAYAMRKARSADPAAVAGVLRNTKGWQGVTGSHTFDQNGDLVNKRLATLVVRNGKFVYLERQPAMAPGERVAAAGGRGE